jgi:phosphatidylinositol glycan anchor class Y biosynthesis protein
MPDNLQPTHDSLLFTQFNLRNYHHFQIGSNAKYYGFLIASLSIIVAIVSLYAIIFSKFSPDFEIKYLDSIKQDHYFCYLVPLTLLPTVVVIYLNWFAMRLFEQN